jgi:hypothetical protein
MENQVGYFMNLLHKIFVECNSSGESSLKSSQSEVGSGPTSQATGAESQSAVESQQAVVQYLKVSAVFNC